MTDGVIVLYLSAISITAELFLKDATLTYCSENIQILQEILTLTN